MRSGPIRRTLALIGAMGGLAGVLCVPGCDSSGSAEAAKEKYAQGAKDPAGGDERDSGGNQSAPSGNQQTGQ